MSALTKKQTEILYFIESYRNENGISPTLREIMSNFQFNSTSTCWKHIDNLKKKGVLTQDAKKWRSILLKDTYTEATEKTNTVTVIGKISRGLPIDLMKNIATVQVPTHFFTTEHHRYGFIIKDRTFEDLHVLKDDLIIIQNKPPLQADELVFCLNSENYVDLIFHKELLDFDCVQGVVISLLRYWNGIALR